MRCREFSGTWFRRITATCTLLATAFPGTSTTAQERAKAPIDVSPMAKKLVDVLKLNGKTEVAMGDFVSPPQSNASAGTAIRIALTEELSARGITIKKRTEWAVVGGYRLENLGLGNGLTAQIEGRIEDRIGTKYFEGTWELGGEPAILTLFGPSSTLPLDQGEEGREKAILASIEAPKATIKGSKVLAGPDSPYAVEVAVASGDAWLPLVPSDSGGLAFVPIKRGQRYSVTLVNDADEDAAVTLTIDGLNVFAFSNNKDYKFVIIPKKSRGRVSGWHRTNEVSDSFLITELAKGAAAEIGLSSSDVGTITATFAAAWPKGSPAPRAEEALMASRGGPIATGRGPEIQAKFKEVERRVGTPRGVVSIRYDKAR